MYRSHTAIAVSKKTFLLKIICYLVHCSQTVSTLIPPSSPSHFTRSLSAHPLSVYAPAICLLAAHAVITHHLSAHPLSLHSPAVCPLASHAVLAHPLSVRSLSALSLLTRCLSACHTRCPCSPIICQLARSLSPHQLSVHSLALYPLTRFLSARHAHTVHSPAACPPAAHAVLAHPLSVRSLRTLSTHSPARLLTYPHACSSARVPATPPAHVAHRPARRYLEPHWTPLQQSSL